MFPFGFFINPQWLCVICFSSQYYLLPVLMPNQFSLSPLHSTATKYQILVCKHCLLGLFSVHVWWLLKITPSEFLLVSFKICFTLLTQKGTLLCEHTLLCEPTSFISFSHSLNFLVNEWAVSVNSYPYSTPC